VDSAEAILPVLRTTFGSNCVHLLRINSGSGDAADSGGVPSLWHTCHAPCLPGGGAGEPESRAEPENEPDIGLNLTAADLEGLAIFMRDFTVGALK
jgi:hypothetical protein